MKPSRLSDRVQLLHMRDAARRALELSEGKRLYELSPDHETALAVVRLLEILDEAARGVSEELRVRFPEVPWREVAATRNRLIHEYFEVDMAIVAAIVEEDLPALLAHVERVLAYLEEA